MTTPTNRMSYQDIYEVLDEALADPKGIRLPFNKREDAMYYRMRIHTARSVDRRENAKLYKPGDPLHGQSMYDTLIIRMIGPQTDPNSPTGETTFLYIEPKDKNRPEIESLSELEDEETADHG